MASEKSYTFARCLWAQQHPSAVEGATTCPACQTQILDLTACDDEDFEALFRHSDERICVKCTPSRFRVGQTLLRYAGYLAVGVLPFTSSCQTMELPASPEASSAAVPCVEDEFFVGVIVEKIPELIGGLAQLQQQLVYPPDALDAGIEGRVIVQYLVDEQGEPQDVEVVRGLCPSCDREAMRLIAQARFIPGSLRCQVVPVRMSLPITFRLPRP